MTLHIDLETRSPLKLKDVGVYAYARHPQTRILCMAWAWNDAAVCATTSLDVMRNTIRDAASRREIRAFNAAFERLFVKHKFGLVVPLERFICTAAQARSNAYPGNLDDCARALGIDGKDMDGYHLMLKLTNADSPEPTPEELERLALYCKRDVEIERLISQMLRPLPYAELADYHLNERINDRGVKIDRQFCRAATQYADAERSELNTKIKTLTLGVVEKVTQNKRIAKYLGLSSVRRDLIDELLDSDGALTEHERAVLELRLAGSNTTTSKFAKMDEAANEDDRLRGMFVFAGAGQTGRYSSRLVQVHNLARDVPALHALAIRDICAGMKPEVFRMIYGDIIYNLSRLVRPALLAAPGKKLLIGDFVSVEARGLPWLANAAAEVQAYHDGIDRYVEDASAIFNVNPSNITRGQRQIGKVARLSLGFGGGTNAFTAMARNYGVKVDEALAMLIVSNWRRANPWATQFWNDIHNAAVGAVRHPDTEYRAGKLSYMAHEGTLWCRLPSDRLIAYPQVRLDMVDGAFGSQFQLSAIKAQWKPAKGQTEWPRVTLWHGLLVENADQAACNDLLRNAMHNLAAADYEIVTHTHDEIVAEITPCFTDDGECQRFKLTMERRPPWANDFPLAAEVHIAQRYTK